MQRAAKAAPPDAATARAEKPRILAAVSQLADSFGVRLLATGGPIFMSNGLISPRVSRFATVIADPSRVVDFGGVLLANGWVRREPPRGLLPPLPSRFDHPDFRCALQVHFAFPGFFRSPPSAFEVLWARRRQVTMAGVPVAALDRVSMGLLVTARHIERRGAQDDADLDFMVRQFISIMTDAERSELHGLVGELGATGGMRRLLSRFGVALEPYEVPSRAYGAWRLVLDMSVRRETLALLGVIEAPRGLRGRTVRDYIRHEPALVLRAILCAPCSFFVIAGTARRRRRAQLN